MLKPLYFGLPQLRPGREEVERDIIRIDNYNPVVVYRVEMRISNTISKCFVLLCDLDSMQEVLLDRN